MDKKRVSLRAPARPNPTEGYVRGRGESEKTSGQEPGGGSPPIRGETTTPVPAETGGVDGVVKAWRALAPAERKQALALMSLDMQRGSGGEAADRDLWAEAVQEALAAALGPSDGAGHGPQVVRRVVAAPAAWSPIADFFSMARLDAMPKNHRYAVMRLLARLLVQRAKKVAHHADIPLTPKLVATNAQHIAGIFDSAFPGYASSPALVSIVARRLIGGEVRNA